MGDQSSNNVRKRHNRPYMLTIRQSVSVKPKYDIYRGGMKAVYTIEGDVTKHVYSVRKDGAEVMKLRKKLAKLLPEYTIEKDGREIAHIKKRLSLLTHDLEGMAEGKTLEIRPNWDAFKFDILVDGRKLCQIEQKAEFLSDSYEIMMFDESMEELAVALAVICDHVSDKEEKSRTYE